MMTWQNEVQSMLDEIAKENEIPEQSLLLIENKSLDGEKTTSYSVVIREPEYPNIKGKDNKSASNFSVMRIEEKKANMKLTMNVTYFDKIHIPEFAEANSLATAPAYVRIFMPKEMDSLVALVKQITEVVLNDYVPSAQTFGCCGKYVECSDAMRCLHENQLYSRACMYRKNLEAGRIFYGKNKNAD